MSEQVISVPSKFKGVFQPYRYKAFYGGRGSAKSHSVAIALLILAAKSPLRIFCGREIQKSIKDSVKKLLEDKIAAYNLGGFYTSTETEIRGQNGSLFIFAGIKTNPESMKSIEGIDIAWIEEASTVSQRSLDILIPTIRKEGSEIWFTWNPDRVSDPVDAMFRGANPPKNSLIQEVTWRDNPYFTDVLKAELEHDRETNNLKYLHVWEGAYDQATETKVLRRIKENATATVQEPLPNREYIMGVDLGRHQDFTVIIIMDTRTHKMVYFDRFNQIDWNLQKARIEAVARRYNNATIRIDATGLGDPISGDLRNAGLMVDPYVFTNSSKKVLIENLSLKLEQDAIKIIQVPELIEELESLRWEKTASGNIRYEAPEGKHDDCVMSLALAVYQLPDKALIVYDDVITDDNFTIRYNSFGEPIY